ncbi:MAG: amidohydrolase family protein [Oscillospiraceae bacterium]|nr:amidohydrolase family protein [Oscillospiraceae bacterium]
MKYAFINMHLLSGREDMKPQDGLAVLVDGEKIVDIVAESAVPAEYEKKDLGGRYLMPGLINLHVHIPGSGKPQKKPMDVKKTIKLMTCCGLARKMVEIIYQKYANTALLSGVTTIRTVGGLEDYDSKLRDKIRQGKVQGPRILASNMAVSVPGGHMAGSLAYEATTPEEAAAFVRKIAEDKPDLIKLMITGGVLDAEHKGEPGVLRMQPELVKAACDEAHRLGLQVAAHVESPEGVRVALENGVDTIEHGAKPDEEILRLFKERGAALVATLSPALPFALFDREVSNCTEIAQFNGKIVFDGIIDCAKACVEQGIPVGLGTDTGCPYVTHYGMWRELHHFSRFCGVSNAFALYTATCRNAEIAGLGDQLGTVEPGKLADLIVTGSNPLEDLQALRNVSMVVTGGKIIDHPKVKKMPQVEQELDKFL